MPQMFLSLQRSANIKNQMIFCLKIQAACCVLELFPEGSFHLSGFPFTSPSSLAPVLLFSASQTFYHTVGEYLATLSPDHEVEDSGSPCFHVSSVEPRTELSPPWSSLWDSQPSLPSFATGREPVFPSSISLLLHTCLHKVWTDRRGLLGSP